MSRVFLGICSTVLIIGCGSAASPATGGGADASVDSGPVGITATGIAAPSQFTCTSASKGAAGFSWQKSPTDGVVAYVVERATLTSDFVAMPPVDATATTFADLTLAQAETYRYRVRAKVGEKLGDSSNEVSVGAMPPGFQTAAASPAGAEATTGTNVDLALDNNGDPALVYFDGVALQFLGWDRRSASWRTPVVVTSNLAAITAAAPAASLAFSPGGSAGTLAVVWVNPDASEIDWALSSDGGKTWQKDTVATAPVKSAFSLPTIAIGNGKAHIAWLQDGAKLFYATGTLSTPPKGWTAKLEAPPATSADALLPFAPSIALDAGQNPALAYFSHGTANTDGTSGGVIATYWQPGQAHSITIMNSLGYADPSPSISLAYAGSAPLAAVTLHHSATTIAPVWFVTSTHGDSWGTALALPVDGNGGGGLSTRLVTTPKGASAVVYASATPGGGKCGEPKLATSSDGTTWSTCSPDVDASRSKSANFGRIVLTAAGQKLMAWQDPNKGGGVVVWREP